MAEGSGREQDRSLGLPWQGPAVGLLDLDAFFASVEQLDHPDWRGLPVIVGGSPERRGVVSTASYEARRFGVHSAMPSWQARRLCPGAIWTPGRFDRYRELSRAVMGIVQDETPLVEQVSIDEAFFDVTPGRWSRESPLDICRRIQLRVRKLGITCSIGLGTSKTVAKIASERQKPRGLTVVPPGAEAAFLAPLPVRAMSGIGPATERRLQELDVRTLGDLALRDEAEMRRALGSVGPQLVRRARGMEGSPVRETARPEEAKSVSNERTFSHDLLTREEVDAAIGQVSALVGERLRKRGLRASTVTLKLKFDYLHARTAQRALPRPTDDERRLAACARGLLSGLWSPGLGIRLVGVGASDFGEGAAEQLSLFTDEKGDERDLRALSLATDEVRRRFGKSAIAYGRNLRLEGRDSDTLPMNGGGA
ncbi:DNA polymerase IV [Olsenella sp. DNF00959]|uniref:DNA polymerase IV n=1 Tax=Olsenella sp. DNF00959 TaxID=1476999 RepID=UPI000781BC5B|nr:DNA polymerase IV [Olsenella sp. DNF00959]KXB62637.1 putative DNA polymerase IV [Olsenella sp. DNF00959]